MSPSTILAVVLALACATAGVQTLRLSWLERDVAERDAALRTVALASSENTRALERTLTAKVQEAQHARESELEALRNRAAGLRADRDGLRDDLARYALGTAGDPPGACRDRAAALGNLLDDAVRVAAACAGAAEGHAADVRALLGAWPVADPVSTP